MFLGSSSFIPVTKAVKKEVPQPESTASHLTFLDSSIEGTSFEVARLPNPNNPRDSALYLVSGDRLYWLRGIKPGVNPVSLFVDEKILNEDYFLATFKFDAIFIIIAILFLDPDKFISIPQRIYELYRGGLDESQGYGALEAGAFTVWNNNIDNIQERLEYLCDSMKLGDSKDTLFKPNLDKFRAMLSYKVQNLEKYVRERNVMMAAYCSSTVTSKSNYLQKHQIEFDDRRLRSFAWTVVSTMLSPEARNCLVPQNLIISEKPTAVEVNTHANTPIITSGNKVQKKRKIAGAAGTSSIMDFFKPK